MSVALSHSFVGSYTAVGGEFRSYVIFLLQVVCVSGEARY